jgi:hypothetical protein
VGGFGIRNSSEIRDGQPVREVCTGAGESGAGVTGAGEFREKQGGEGRDHGGGGRDGAGEQIGGARGRATFVRKPQNFHVSGVASSSPQDQAPSSGRVVPQGSSSAWRRSWISSD